MRNVRNNATELYKVKVFSESWLGGRLNRSGSRLRMIALAWLFFGILPFLAFSVVTLFTDVWRMPETLPERIEVILPSTMNLTIPDTHSGDLPGVMTVILPETMSMTLRKPNAYAGIGLKNALEPKPNSIEVTFGGNLTRTMPKILTEKWEVDLPSDLIITLPDNLIQIMMATPMDNKLEVIPQETITVTLPEKYHGLRLREPIIVTLPNTLFVTPTPINNDGFIEDQVMLSYFIFVPALLTFVILYFPAFPGVMETFRQVATEYRSQNKASTKKEGNNEDTTAPVPLVSTEKLNQLFRNCEGKIRGEGNTKYILAIFIAVGLGWVAYMAICHWTVNYHNVSDIFASKYHIPAFVVRTIYELIVFGFLVPLLSFKWVMILHSMRYVCVELNKENALTIRPLSPDKAGGLGFLGSFSLRMILVLTPMMIPLVFYPIFGELNELFSAGMLLYIPALCFAFLYPLSGAHDAMSKFKKQELGMLSGEFNRIHDEFVRDIRSKRLKQIPDDLALMEKLDQLHHKAETMPVWPFNLQTLSKLGAVIAAVGIPLVFEVIRVVSG